ncbi:histidinol dehydrogenase [Desulfitispora alkaliphila]|uniref:histidinol dehydrogenase n=1 Tax=Desulfitispora alkaliphila TaxID=622674 RepID=UPI003D1CD5F6
MIKVLAASDDRVEELLAYNEDYDQYEQSVDEVLKAVKAQGDNAVFQLTEKFDGSIINQKNFKVSQEEFQQAYEYVDEKFLGAIREAVSSITAFHKKQLRNSWLEPEADGTIMGQIFRPISRAGIYVPGGSASYPSSVIMNAVPAKVAGVQEIVMVTPPEKNSSSVNPYTLVAAKEAGVTEIYKMGGAQAIAALAYGTESVSKVDLITGPGNIYVTLAKKKVYGIVEIDMLAGPSEIVIVADKEASPKYVAADLLSQAEHDPLAAAILVTPAKELVAKVQEELKLQLDQLSRKEIAHQSLADRGAIVLTEDLDESFKIANILAPEHLELLIKDPFGNLGKVENAGAIFLGENSPEPIGDYIAGPNHVLPTGGTAKFYSPLNVDTFMKKSSVISYSKEALRQKGEQAIVLAEREGLTAHANAVKIRIKNKI